MPENTVSTLTWIVASGLLMSALALVGSLTLVLSERALERLLMPLVAFAAGSLIGGAFLHMIPVGLAQFAGGDSFFLWVLLGFFTFFVLEQFLHWHHSHRARQSGRQPMTYLILLGDGLHNFIGGLVAYFAAARIDVAFLVPFAAGNFIYIGASDLVPEVKRHQERGASFVHLLAFAAGLALMWLIRQAFAQ